MTVTISPADHDDTALVRFLRAHLTDLAPTAPAESQHAFDVATMNSAPGFQLWVAGLGGEIVGTVGLCPVAAEHEELKSMRTAPEHRGRGIGRALLDHALGDAKRRGIERLSLETGSMGFFAPARSLYTRAGFVECPPFGDYPVDDANSVFMTLVLRQ